MILLHQIILYVLESIEKWQYNIAREAAKITALSPGKIYKYEYLTVEEILSSNQMQIKDKLSLHILL